MRQKHTLRGGDTMGDTRTETLWRYTETHTHRNTQTEVTHMLRETHTLRDIHIQREIRTHA